ncbi:MAG: methylmalonyl-CoA mutase family protein [Lentisphaeria bacterium]|nr:methylmalonyl-CoA mutase family protein [Lentisphaeria bacterium]
MNRKPKVLTAVAQCDGHDASIQLVNRYLREDDIDVIYLGFNKSAKDIVHAAIQEDSDAIAISSYNGGHISFLNEIIDELARQNSAKRLLYIGGGGTISLDEADYLEEHGVDKVFRPGISMTYICARIKDDIDHLTRENPGDFSSYLSNIIYNGIQSQNGIERKIKVIGLTGKGGSGKSTLMDELIFLFLQMTDLRIGIISSDPTFSDRLRMNYLNSENGRIFMRSFQSSENYGGLFEELSDVISAFEEYDYDLILLESAGIGQMDQKITDYSDLSIYLMTPDYGADSQLPKEAMLDKADIVILNKADIEGAETRFQRIKKFLSGRIEALYKVEARCHNSPSVNAVFQEITKQLHIETSANRLLAQESSTHDLIPFSHRNYLGDIVSHIESYYETTELEVADLRKFTERQDTIMSKWQDLKDRLSYNGDISELTNDPDAEVFLEGDTIFKNLDDQLVPCMRRTPIKTWLPVIALPNYDEAGSIHRYFRKQNIPGEFPFTEGAFHYRRRQQDPARMFAGLGLAEDTNKRFFLLNQENDIFRISTAFDGPTLYGVDSDEPGILHKVGEGGVAIDSVEDMERLFNGIDLKQASVSMTINGPAPIIYAMYIRMALDRGYKMADLRGTVQADILKEVQAQNECIFPMQNAMKLLGDMIEYSIERIPHFYPISISGYHIGEAGANPIQELAYTLANAFTYIEYLSHRGLDLDSFGPRLSFFFTSGTDMEFNVLGRVARRIWAIATSRRYAATDRTQRLKFHTQTSGRTLLEKDPLNNLIRVTMQAERALHNNSNSLHTNSYKEAYTTPDHDDAILALACQQIPLKEMGDFHYIENLSQGAYGIDVLTDQVEKAVLEIFSEIDREGGVLKAIENEYFRTEIHRSSRQYESDLHDGVRKVVGLNYLRNEDAPLPNDPLVRTAHEKQDIQVEHLTQFKKSHRTEYQKSLDELQNVMRNDGNIFEELLNTVQVCSLGQICKLFHEEWGFFRPGR